MNDLKPIRNQLIGKQRAYQAMFSINVRMPDELIDTLKLAAADQDRSFNGFVRYVLWSSLAKEGYIDPAGSGLHNT